MVDVLKEGDTWVKFYKSIPAEVSLPMPGSDIFNKYWNEHPLDRPLFMGHPYPRYQQNYGFDYHYAGTTHKAKPIDSFPDDFLNKVLLWSNNHMKENKFYGPEENKDLELNSLLINWYDEGHYIGPHSDNERCLVKTMPIYSFSFGCSRDFVLHPKVKGREKTYVFLPHNSLLIMGGTCQETHKHSVPKRKHSGKRINITIRSFK